jgi:uncharacterized protein HemY
VAVDDQLERAAVVFVLSSVLQRVKMEELVPTLIAIAVVFFAVRWLINRVFMSSAGEAADAWRAQARLRARMVREAYRELHWRW